MATSLEYRRRKPEESVLYAAIERGLEQFFTQAQQAGREVPRFIERELRGYLRCGRPEYGFAHIECSACGLERVVGSRVVCNVVRPSDATG